jgi:hypothetical protein
VADFGVDDNILSDSLGELDLDAYAGAIEESLLEDRGATLKVHRKLQLMKLELRFPYRDKRLVRAPFLGPDDLDKFEATTKESLQALPVGLLVRCRVSKADGRFGLQVAGFDVLVLVFLLSS